MARSIALAPELRYRRGRARTRASMARNARSVLRDGVFAFPVLFLMSLAMTAFGQYALTMHMLDQLAAGAASASSGSPIPSERAARARAFVARAAAASPFLHPADLHVTTETTGLTGSTYEVTVDYNLAHTPIPLVAGLFALTVGDVQRTAVLELTDF